MENGYEAENKGQRYLSLFRNGTGKRYSVKMIAL